MMKLFILIRIDKLCVNCVYFGVIDWRTQVALDGTCLSARVCLSVLNA